MKLSLDGQNITNGASTSGFGQPIISRDAIAEYQIITNLFDVTMGRSLGGRPGDCAVTEDVAERILRLPFYTNMTDDEQGAVIDALLSWE